MYKDLKKIQKGSLVIPGPSERKNTLVQKKGVPAIMLLSHPN